MFTDTELRVKGVEILISALGTIEAERFISLILKEPFDYTKWQKKLWEDVPVKNLSLQAMKAFKRGSQKPGKKRKKINDES